MKRQAQLHDREIDQMAGKGDASCNQDIALLHQHRNHVTQTAGTQLIHIDAL